jgi:hypothetical protein
MSEPTGSNGIEEGHFVKADNRGGEEMMKHKWNEYGLKET